MKHPYLFVPSILLSATMVSASDEAATQPKGEAAITMLHAINHRMLGNMPQAFSHVGLINAALALHDAGATRAGRT